MRDARAALDALREEEAERRRREAEEAERQRQLQMAQKLDLMRKKKAEYLEYQRQVPTYGQILYWVSMPRNSHNQYKGVMIFDDLRRKMAAWGKNIKAEDLGKK